MQLITTQLIEEYQKEMDAVEIEIKAGIFPWVDEKLLIERRLLKKFITSLQSKQSEERQNIVDAFENGAVSETRGTYNGSEDYLKKTFNKKHI